MEINIEDLIKISNKRPTIIEKSQDGSTRAKIENGISYYLLPEDLYEEFYARKEAIEEAQKQRDAAYDKETEEAIASIFRQKRTPKYNIDCIPITRSNPEVKREIKRPIVKQKKKYKGSKRLRAKATLAAILISLSIGGSVYGIEQISKSQKEYEAVATEVQNLSDEEIKSEIYDILKQEVADATKENKEDITFWRSQPDSGTIRTEVNAGKTSYEENIDLRSPFNIDNTLKSKGISTIIEEATSAKSRKDLIKTLVKTKKFSKEKDLEVDGKNLKEVKAEEDNER